MILLVEHRPSLPVEVKITLFRLAQEALNNIAKNARARQVTARLHRAVAEYDDGEVVHLQIVDDGRGFDPKQLSPARLGLTIMQERAAAIGATLTIASRPGQGTRIEIIWPGAV